MPGALVGARLRAFHAVKALEQARHFVCGDADARVGDFEHGVRAVALQPTETWPASVNLNAFDSRLRTIFSHISRSTCTGCIERRQSHVELEPGAFHGRAEIAGQVLGEQPRDPPARTRR